MAVDGLIAPQSETTFQSKVGFFASFSARMKTKAGSLSFSLAGAREFNRIIFLPSACRNNKGVSFRFVSHRSRKACAQVNNEWASFLQATRAVN